ncbi:NAD-dependent epimerase/dehydratase family protein [Liberiplasma polymorphum]|uniref:NAD-dependent epimerase/dehydratase family protein n=1 Tax=Liberiplasma polymorphum TaxID=3374570 RepID=UPI0037765DD2
MKKVLVMGGSYFIGKHIVNSLKKDYEVTVLNRGNKPFNDSLVHELVCDRNDEGLLKEVLSPYMFNYVIDISGFTKHQSALLLNALDLCQLEKFIYISTSAAYNIQVLTPPFKEGDLTGGDSPFKDYAKNKLEAEAYLLNTIDNDKLIILRPPLVYGEDNYILRERLIFYLLDNDLPIYIPSSNNLVSFVYVKDLAQDIKRLIENIIPVGLYNVGNKHPHSFKHWVELCAKVMDKSPNIVFVDPKDTRFELRYYFPFFDYDNVLSVEKIKQFSPNETPMEDGLKKAFLDYLTVKDTIKLPEKMRLMREKINELNNQ